MDLNLRSEGEGCVFLVVSLLLSKIYFSLGSKMMSGMTNILANVEKFLFLQMCIKSMNWHRGMSQYCN